jgi:hypothetical protein
MCFLLSALFACSSRSEARPWSLTDIAPLLAGTDTIEVASTGAVLFNDHYADLKHNSIEETWLVLDSNGATREIPRRLRIAKLHWAPDGRRLAALLEEKDGTQQLFWMDADTFAVTRLTHALRLAIFRFPPTAPRSPPSKHRRRRHSVTRPCRFGLARITTCWEEPRRRGNS